MSIVFAVIKDIIVIVRWILRRAMKAMLFYGVRTCDGYFGSVLGTCVKVICVNLAEKSGLL